MVNSTISSDFLYDNNNGIKLFSCYHKDYPIFENNIVSPIHVGKACSNNTLSFIGDDINDNISNKNPYFCELTATYWIWKNIKADVVGLFHYRRYLNLLDDNTKDYYLNNCILDKYGITQDNIKSLLNDFDIVVPCQTQATNISVYDYYKKEHIIEDLDITLDVIKELHPSYFEIAKSYFLENSQMYCGNMLIANKEIFDEYAQWLFSILFAVEKRIHSNVINRNTYQQRVYGFLAERLMGVFLKTRQDLRVKEVPLLFLEEDIKRWKKYKFRRFKKKVLTYFTLGIIK